MSERLRLDQAISARFPEISRRKAKELLAKHRVLVNDRPVSVASRMIDAADRITIVAELPELTILAITSDLIAVDKPAGLPVQPTRDRRERSLEELLRLRLQAGKEARDLYLVHRIDSGTSGVVLFARTRAMAAELSRFFAEGSMQKRYLAAVTGTIETERTIDSPIVRADESSFRVATDGRAALTMIRPLARSSNATLIEADIATGRTHQIRVHLASIAHPLLGDRKYGGPAAPRLMLHAWQLAHPNIGSFIAPVPAVFRELFGDADWPAMQEDEWRK